MGKNMCIKDGMSPKNPFKVPTGYFEGFTSKLMDKLPECAPTIVQCSSPRIKVVRKFIYAAACLMVGVVCTAIYFAKAGKDHMQGTDSSSMYSFQMWQDTYDEMIADYAMMDNADIYIYLMTDNYAQ